MTNERHRKRSESLFGPVLLIALGAFFLLRNFGMLPDANWGLLFQLWPLWLIFLGLNIVVQQVPRPGGNVLSVLVGITAVTTAIFLLFFSDDSRLLNRLGVQANQEIVQETISFSPEEITSAEVELNFGIVSGEVYALEPTQGLIDGQVSYVGNLIFETDADSNGEATVLLDTESNGPWNWFTDGFPRLDGANQWQIGLNPRTPLNLRIDSGTGAVDLDLAQLTLNELVVDSGTGRIGLLLPEGEYEMRLNSGTGASSIVFPENGRIFADIDGGTGGFQIVIPEGMPARIEFDSGTGGISLDGRFTLVEGEQNGDGIWETADYTVDGDGIELYIDIGTGGVRVVSSN